MNSKTMKPESRDEENRTLRSRAARSIRCVIDYDRKAWDRFYAPMAEQESRIFRSILSKFRSNR